MIKLGFINLNVFLFLCIFSLILVEVVANENEKTDLEQIDNRYILYSVNFGEGFNLRRDVYMRFANLIRFLNAKAIKKNIKYTLVLPPWGRIYHWFDHRDAEKIPWSQFFDIESLNLYVPVIEFANYLNLSQKGVLDVVFYMQRYPDGEGLSNTIPWEDKAHIRPCLESNEYYFDKSCDCWRGWMFGYSQDVKISNFTCLSVQMGVESMVDFILSNITEKHVMFDRGETLIHGHYSEWSDAWWSARRSMVFSFRLRKLANRFRAVYLNSTNVKDGIYKKPDWRYPAKAGAIRGGPYLGFHMRLKDFTYAHSDATPTIEVAAEHIRHFLKKSKLDTVYIASDEKDLGELSSLLSEYKIFRYEADSALGLRDGDLAIIDQIICSHAAVFVGTDPSTFSFRIVEERNILGFPADKSKNSICANPKISECKLLHSWDLKLEPEFTRNEETSKDEL